MSKRNLHIISIIILMLGAIRSCIGTEYPRDLFLQHIGTIITISMLIRLSITHWISNFSFLSISVFLVFHIIGARWTYSNVPYDYFSKTYFHFSINDFFCLKRNNYDRLVHFLYGVLLTLPYTELLFKKYYYTQKQALFLAFNIIATTSLFYELIEWLFTYMLAESQATTYLGQQGDMWDAHKDMALALFGSLISICISLLFQQKSYKLSIKTIQG